MNTLINRVANNRKTVLALYVVDMFFWAAVGSAVTYAIIGG